VSSILPAVTVFGIGLTLVVAPVTATVLAAADSRHSGMASGVNNAVARVGSLLAVAVLPLVAGLTGDKFYDPVAMEDGFHIALIVCAGLSVLGGLIAFAWIRSDLLSADEDEGEPEPDCYSCDVAGTRLSPDRHDPEAAVSSS
jgi:MFS family permease